MKARMLIVSALMCAMVSGTPVARGGDLGNPAKALASMNREQIEIAKKRYLACLESSNEGIIQSTLGIVLQWRVMTPREDFSSIEQKINDLALHGASPSIRFKAALASLVIENPAVLNFNVADCQDCEELFEAITHSLRQMTIGQRIQ